MFRQKRHQRTAAEAAPLDPIALSIAIWLGLVVSSVGIGRLIEAAQLPPPAQVAAAYGY